MRRFRYHAGPLRAWGAGRAPQLGRRRGPGADPEATASTPGPLGLRRDLQVPRLAELAEGDLRRTAEGPEDPGHRLRSARPLSLLGRLPPGALPPPAPSSPVGGRAEPDDVPRPGAASAA